MSHSDPSDGRRVAIPVLLIRWAQVGAVVGVVLYSSVAAVAAYFGGDDGTVSTEPPVVAATTTASNGAGTDSTAAAAGDAAPATEPPATEPPATEPPATEPVVTGPPSAANPASVYIVGDSDAGTFGPFLQELLDGTTVATTALNYKTSSGLARPDFFDWPAELSAKLPEVDPDIVVVTFGGNDAQGLRNRDLSWVVQDPVANEDVWTAEYVRRAGEIMDLLLANDRTVIWVGIPSHADPNVAQRMAIQDRAAKAAAAARPGVTFVDPWTRFSGRDGGFAEFVVDPRDNIGKDVRLDDGFHLNVNGAEILALDIAQVVRDDLRARGANI